MKKQFFQLAKAQISGTDGPEERRAVAEIHGALEVALVKENAGAMNQILTSIAKLQRGHHRTQ